MSQYPLADFTDYPHVPPGLSMNVTYYRSRVTVNVPYYTVPIVGDSEKYFVNTQLSRDEAAKDALSKLATQAMSLPSPDSQTPHDQQG